MLAAFHFPRNIYPISDCDERHQRRIIRLIKLIERKHFIVVVSRKVPQNTQHCTNLRRLAVRVQAIHIIITAK